MVIELKKNLYPLEAILSACHSFFDKAYMYIDCDAAQTKYLVELTPRVKMSATGQAGLKGDFLNELIHAALRFKVSKDNKKIREYIVGKALYSSVIEGEDQVFDYQDDPLNIAVPWEDKYGKNKKAANGSGNKV